MNIQKCDWQSFSLFFVCSATACHQTIKQSLTAVGARIGGYNHFLSPGGCILSLGASLCLARGCSGVRVCLCVCMRVCLCVCVHAFFWTIWHSPDLHWWEQGKTSGCRHWQPLLITLTTGPEWHHHRAVTVICAGRQTDVNRIKE